MDKIGTKTTSIRKSSRLIERNRISKEQSAKSAQTVSVTKKTTKVDPVIESKSKPKGRRLRPLDIEQDSSTKVIEKLKPHGRVIRSPTICGVNLAQNDYVTEAIPAIRKLRSRQLSFYESSTPMVQKGAVIKSPTKGRLLRNRSQTVGTR